MTKVITPSTDNAVLTPVSLELLFKGRPGDLRLGEWVLTQMPNQSTQNDPFSSVYLMGCPDDLGVRLNLGRAGAQAAPKEIRRAFYKIAVPRSELWKKIKLYDCGDIAVSTDILESHQNAKQAAETLSKLGGTLILLGGGHDFAAPGFLGFVNGRRSLHSSERLGLINIDPHLDVRERENGKPHSGTPFRDILNSRLIEGKHLIQFGCRENRNAKAHFEFCEERGVSLKPLELLRQKKEPVSSIFQKHLRALSKQVDTVGITLDMDSCAEVIGTSAAPALGFSIQELHEIAYLAGTFPNVGYFELAEVAPSLDPSGKTPLVAAEILYAFLNGKAHGSQLASSGRENKNLNKTLKNKIKTDKKKR